MSTKSNRRVGFSIQRINNPWIDMTDQFALIIQSRVCTSNSLLNSRLVSDQKSTDTSHGNKATFKYNE